MSKSSLLFSIDQWEFIRRLRNSGLTKEQICQAFDDLDRIERELGSIFNTTTTTTAAAATAATITTTTEAAPINSNNNEPNILNLLQQQFSTDPALVSKNLQNFQLFMAKNIAALNFHQRMLNQAATAAAVNSQTSPNSSAPLPSPTINTTTTTSATITTTTNTNTTISTTNTNNSTTTVSTNTNHVNNLNRVVSPVSVNNTENPSSVNTLHSYDLEDEIKELEEFRNKGDINIHHEISQFVHKHDLKQSHIARLAGVNQAYVSKFLRGDFSDLSENGKTLIYKWYLKCSKNPLILVKNNGQFYNNSNSNNIDHLNGNDSSKIIKLDNNNNNNSNNNGNSVGTYSFLNMINSYEAPKRTRFSFKPDHLAILEKSFMENPYPDPKKREELAKLCNSVRHTSDLSDRERVTEQIVTHWFQNKRKLTRRVNCDDSMISACNDQLSTSPQNDENNNSCEQINNKNNINSSNTNNNNHLHHQQQQNNQNGDSLDYDVDDSPIDYQDFMDEAQIAAYKAIMSRMNNKSPTSTKTDFNDDLNLNTEIS